MLRSSTLEKPSPEAPVAGATDIVEATTTQAAIAEVRTRLGPDARIVDARRVLRGGIGGFFAKEVVQLHAAAGPFPARVTTDASAEADVDASLHHTHTGAGTGLHAADGGDGDRPGTAGAGNTAPDLSHGAGPWDAVLQAGSGGARGGSDGAVGGSTSVSPVDRLLGSVGDDVPDTIDFATFLRRQLGGGPGDTRGGVVPQDEPAPQDQPVPQGQPVPQDQPAPQGQAVPWNLGAVDAPAMEGVPWSTSALLQLGLPAELVRSLDVAEPADDVAWTRALAEALRPSCRPLPLGPAVLLGPHAHLVGKVDGTPAARSETWLNALRDGRWLHLVVGGDGWRALLAEEPLAVSWAREEDLADAVRCAVELGLVLGYGPMGGRIRRARPLDVALAVRDQVDGR